MHALEMLVPGDIHTLTGGYEYDRRMLEGLRERGWRVRLHELGAGFPFPSPAALDQVTALLATFPGDSRVLIDGLALGAMPAQARVAAARMQIVGLVHHPLALESGLSSATAAHLRQSELQALHCVARIIVTSAATADTLRDWGIADAAIRVVEPGTDARPQAARDLPRLLRPDHVPRLLCVATLVPRKGHDLLLEALEALRDLPWRLDCVGSDLRDPVTAAHLRARTAAAGLADRITWHGEVTPALLASLHAEADLFVLATRYEGYGMAVADAVAMGLPVVSTCTGAIPQWVTPERGILVQPDDSAGLQHALHWLLSDPPQLHRLAALAQAGIPAMRGWSDAAALFAEALLA